MANRYIPPHLRKELQAQNSGTTPETQTGDTNHGTSMKVPRRRLADLKIGQFENRGAYSLEEIEAHFGDGVKSSTLHESATRPGELAYILLFRNANPRWATDNIVFAHTNIHLLPDYKTFKAEVAKLEGYTAMENRSLGVAETVDADVVRLNPAEKVGAACPLASQSEQSAEDEAGVTAKVFDPEIQKQLSSLPTERPSKEILPIFSESPGRKSRARFTFTGYYRLLKVGFLKPGSPELVRMLEQKWALTRKDSPGQLQTNTKQREAEKWAESLKREWVVVKLEKADDAGLECPKIERVISGSVPSNGEDDRQSGRGSKTQHCQT